MLKRKNRLVGDKAIKQVYKAGKTFRHQNFTLKGLFLQPTASPRVTVVVSTKVSKKAVVRNKIKRILREQLRLHLAELKPGDYLVIANPPAKNLTPEAIKQNFLGVLKLSNLLKN